MNFLKNIGRYYNNHPWLKALTLAIPYAGSSLDSLLERYGKESEFLNKFKNTDSIIEYVNKIDDKIIDFVRHPDKRFTEQKFFELYQTILSGLSKNNELPIKALLTHLNKKGVEYKIASPDITVCVSKNLEIITFKYDKKSLLIEKPNLLWDCNCDTPLPKGYKLRPCKIHSKPLGNEVHKRFTRGLVKIQYDNVSVFWRLHVKELWPPSIDTFHLISNLEHQGIKNDFLNSVIDIGSGTGILGIWLTKNNKNINKVYFTDWLLTPLFYNFLSFTKEYFKRKVESKYLLGLHTNWLNNEHFSKTNLLVCNPPYLPVVENFSDILYDSTVAGTGLLKHIIVNANNFAQENIISFSNLANEEAKAAEQVSGNKLVPIGKKYEVPFRVIHAFKYPKYMQALKSRGLIYRKDSNHPYWHIVTTYKIVKNSKDIQKHY